MKLKTISFGSNNADLILDISVKSKIINFIFNNLSLSDYRYILLTNTKKLIYLQKNPHYVSPNFRGFNYLIIFMTLDGEKICVAINRKKLKYHKNNINVKQVEIIKLKVDCTDTIYKGTIFDGKLLSRGKDNIYLIQDCYLLMNNKMIKIELEQKLGTLDSILYKQFSNKSCSNFMFKLNKLYNYDSLEKLVTKIIPKISKASFQIQGLIFYPKYSGINIIFVENKKTNLPNYQIANSQSQSDSIKKESINIIKNLNSFLKNRVYTFENYTNKKNKIIVKTDIPDVYEVWDNKIREGIAHVPNMKISHQCQDIFLNKDKAYMNCVYFNPFNKWIPIEFLNYC